MIAIEPHINGTTPKPAKDPETYSLLYADRDAVKRFWPTLIRPGLMRIKGETTRKNTQTGHILTVGPKDKRSGTWQPEHVRQRLEAGFANQIICECYLIIAASSPIPVGFVITQVFNDEFIGCPLYLHIWIAWCEKAPLWRVLPFALSHLEKRAVELGLRGVQGTTSRLQWLRRLRKYGYHIHQVVIRKSMVAE